VLDRLPLPALTDKTHTDRAQLASEIAGARAVAFALAEEEYLDGVSGVAVPVMFEAGRGRRSAWVGPSSRVGSQLERIGRLARESTTALRPTLPRVSGPTPTRAAA
jgi:DNA-binding IclR family transcriptional regulator